MSFKIVPFKSFCTIQQKLQREQQYETNSAIAM